MANGTKRVTLGVLNEKLDHLTQLVQRHVESDERKFLDLHNLLEGPGDQPGIKGRLDRLEVAETSRTWHIRALWGAAFAGFASWLSGKF